jgi:hypothetical protein
VDRGTYALVGVVGFAIKHNIDRLIANRIFGRPFTPFNYWIPPVQAIRIDSLSTTDARFLATMVSIALPFVWIGLAMTVRGLRSANLPLSLVVLFFVPLMNLLFFVVLSLIPARDAKPMTEPLQSSALASFIPRDRLGSSAMAVALTAVMGALATYLGVQRLGTYGWGVRVGGFFNGALACDNVEKTYEELKSRGVEFMGPPQKEHWGTFAMFKDVDGNQFMLSSK